MTTLNLIELTETSPAYKWYLVAIGVFMFVSMIILASTSGANKKKWKDIVFFISIPTVIILLIVFLVVSGSESKFQVPSGKFHIEATFTDNMSFMSVMKEYNIIEQRGDIFVLEPKERNAD